MPKINAAQINHTEMVSREARPQRRNRAVERQGTEHFAARRESPPEQGQHRIRIVHVFKNMIRKNYVELF